MNIYIDCEFDGPRLLSLAMVTTTDCFYEVLENNYANPSPWVRDNVWPVLSKAPIEYEQLQLKAVAYINEHEDAQIVADWPSDIEFLCRVLNLGHGNMYPLRGNKLRFLIDLRLNSNDSLIPHNALADARAIWGCARNLGIET
jgi:hypothetical protein